MLEKSVNAFLDALASKEAVPGGGGASALVAAMGAALGNMAGELTVGKKKYAENEAEIKAAMAQAKDLQEKLALCVEKDAEAFKPLAEAYAIPKDDPDRDAIMEKCLRTAAAAPMEVLELSCRVIDLQDTFAHKGSQLMISDAATGVIFAWGALYGAAVNVKVNTKLMKDRAYAEEINARVDSLVGEYWKKAESIYEFVYQQF